MHNGGSQDQQSADQIERARLARLPALRQAAARARSRDAFWSPEVELDRWDPVQDAKDAAYLAYLAGGQDPRD